MTDNITIPRATVQQALEALERALETSMRQALKARIPECGEFAGIAQDVDWAATALLAALKQQAEPVTAESITDAMMNLVDRLGSESKQVDLRAWQHLLVYAPRQQDEPVQKPPYPGWKPGCQVCGVHGVPGYVCPRSDCPTKVTCGGVV